MEYNSSFGKIVYVVLHYQNQRVTEECVEKLLCLSENTEIVVVDNCSPNNSGKKIAKKYHKSERVHVLQTKRNVGFARGNNVGYFYAKERLNADIIVVMNNDIMIEQIEFEQILQNLYMKGKYYVIGPDIINSAGRHQNPLRREIVSNYKAFRSVIFYSLGVFCIKTSLFKKQFYKLYQSRIDYGQKVVKESDEGFKAIEQECILQGSCVILMKDYIKEHDKAFWPYTFMYVEEDILHEIVLLSGRSEIFVPDLKVRHLEGQSTEALRENSDEKTLFNLRNQAWSYFQLLFCRLIKVRV